MKAIIIEDERPAADRLRDLVQKSGFEIEVIAVMDSIKSSVQWFKENKAPDLVFLDIHLADGQSFEIFKRVDINAPIIFTTAYDAYALKAFEQNCIDYLLKPVDQVKLNKSLEKMHQWLSMGNKKLVMLLEQTFQQREDLTRKYKDRFLVKGKDKLISIKAEQIAYFQSVNKIVLLITYENRSFISDHTIEELESLLNPESFFRLNRGIIANMNAINNMEPYFNGKISVSLKPKTKEPVYVSREKAKMFKVWMGE